MARSCGFNALACALLVPRPASCSHVADSVCGLCSACAGRARPCAHRSRRPNTNHRGAGHVDAFADCDIFAAADCYRSAHGDARANRSSDCHHTPKRDPNSCAVADADSATAAPAKPPTGGDTRTLTLVVRGQNSVVTPHGRKALVSELPRPDYCFVSVSSLLAAIVFCNQSG